MSLPAHRPLSAILIEDFPQPGHDSLLPFLRAADPAVRLVGQTGSLSEGLSAVRRQPSDLVFINLDPAGLLAALRALDRWAERAFVPVVCTPPELAVLRAISKNGVRFLLKPFDAEEVAAAARRACPDRPPMAGRLALRSAGEAHVVRWEKIRSIESEGAYTFAHLIDGSMHVQARALNWFEGMLPSPPFVRVHQSHIANLLFVEKYFPSRRILQMADGAELPIARRRLPMIIEALGLG